MPRWKQMKTLDGDSATGVHVNFPFLDPHPARRQVPVNDRRRRRCVALPGISASVPAGYVGPVTGQYACLMERSGSEASRPGASSNPGCDGVKKVIAS